MQLTEYDEICSRVGFRLPHSYYEFLKLSFETAPDDAWQAFGMLGIGGLSPTVANPNFQLYDDMTYDTGTPAESLAFSTMGCDGALYAFMIDDSPAEPTELPVAEVCFDGCHALLGMCFLDFLAYTIATHYEDEPPLAEASRLIHLIVERFAIPLDDLLDESGHFTGEDKHHAEVRRQREAQGAIPTEDGLGVLLPADTVDVGFLDAQVWSYPDMDILRNAESRLNSGETGTALVLARNFRHHFAYYDWNAERRIMPWTTDILESAYRTMGRIHAAKKVRAQAMWSQEHEDYFS